MLLRDAPLKQMPPGVDASKPDGVAANSRGQGDGIHGHIILPSVNPLGVWDFDDCTSSRTNLRDTTFNDNTAFRSVGVNCGPGIESSQAVEIAAPEDIIYVPDQPAFTFENGVTVAGWFKPNATGGTKTLFRKRDKGTSSFALLLDAGKFEFVVNIGNDIAINVMSPKKAKTGVFQHVAATYDGATVRLYVDGLEVNHIAIAGAIPPGPGPLLMGNDGSERRFAGSIDSALFTTHALTADEILALTCFPRTPTVTMTPGSASTPPGVPTRFDIVTTNNNPAACAPITFSMSTFSFDNRLVLDPTSATSAPVASGATGHMTITATPSDAVDPGAVFFFDADVSDSLTRSTRFLSASVTVIDPPGCHVTTSRELMIKATSVVDDRIRAVFNPSSSDARNGVWTFKHLMENMAPTPADAPAMVEAMLTGFITDQTVNGFTIQARPFMQSAVLDSWPRTSAGALDLSRAPLRLLAIVNRFDLRDPDHGDAGEARFVFSFIDPIFTFDPLQATMTFEYKLPATSDAEALGWAQSFHALGALPFGESYNAALQAITERIVGRNARPDHVNGSAIHSVHTNEIAFGSNGVWQMREFHLSPSTGLLEPAPLTQTPDLGFNNASTLASFINANAPAILADKHTVPLSFGGQPFQAGSVFNNLSTWFAPGVAADARHHFAINTCNGCHSSQETGTFFTHIVPRFAFEEADLSRFLTGVTVNDPVTGLARTFNELGRRRADLTSVVCRN